MDGIQGGYRRVDQSAHRLDAPIRGGDSVEEFQPTNRNVDAAIKSNSATDIKDATDVKSKTDIPQREPERIARPMQNRDIIDQLLSLNLVPTPDNKEKLLSMLQYGIEASKDQFSKLDELVNAQPKSGKSTIESAVISLSKGLSEIPDTVKMIFQYLTGEASFATGLTQMRDQIKTLMSILQNNHEFLEPSLLAGFASVLGGVDDDFQKRLKQFTKGNASAIASREELANGLATLSGFIEGLIQKKGEAENPTAKLQLFLEKLQGFNRELKGLIDQVMAQAILSKDPDRMHSFYNDRFFYWQIPNPNDPNNTIELLIKKDADKTINPNKTQVILNFETQDLGALGVKVDIVDDKVWYVFHTEDAEVRRHISGLSVDLKARMAGLNYTLVGVQSVSQPLNIKKKLLPTFNLNSFSRVRVDI